jgi:hypothetical protein
MVGISAHLPHQVGGGTAVPYKKNVTHEATAATSTVYKLSR